LLHDARFQSQLCRTADALKPECTMASRASLKLNEVDADLRRRTLSRTAAFLWIMEQNKHTAVAVQPGIGFHRSQIPAQIDSGCISTGSMLAGGFGIRRASCCLKRIPSNTEQ